MASDAERRRILEDRAEGDDDLAAVCQAILELEDEGGDR